MERLSFIIEMFNKERTKQKEKNMNKLVLAAKILLIIVGLNLGFAELFGLEIVGRVLGGTVLIRIFNVLVGLSAVLLAYGMLSGKGGSKKKK
jgi:uncharacterized membrane protein YuzA (DUF378 family)